MTVLPNFLLPEMVVRESGAGPELEVRRVKTLLLTLGITRIVPQESLQVSIWGSADGNNWGGAPLVIFPKKFYCGTYPLLIDLSEQPGMRFLRAQWEVIRWGRADATPLFDFYVLAQDVSMPATVSAVA
ncbi:MAG: hypothetical protein ACRD9L_22100 [Bryobacteraceae bacterium]